MTKLNKCRSDVVPAHELAKSMFSSIRDIDVRIQEIKSYMKNSFIAENKRKEYTKRIENLIFTRMSLVNVLIDIRWEIKRSGHIDIEEIFDLKTFYQSIKRQL